MDTIKIDDVHVGKMISNYLAENNIRKSVIAKPLGIQVANLNRILRRQTVTTNFLYRISVAAGYNFFSLWTTQLWISPSDMSAEEPQIGKIISRKMKEDGWTQNMLASRIGMAQQRLSMWLLGNKFDTDILVKISRELNCNFFAEYFCPPSHSHIPTGYPRLDEVMKGWKTSGLNIVASRPSMGKSSFVMTSAINLATEYSMPVMLLTTEMRGEEVLIRSTANYCNVNADDLWLNNLTTREAKDKSKIKELIGRRYHIVFDSEIQTLKQCISVIKRAVSQWRLKAVFIDRLDYLRVDDVSCSRAEESVIIWKELKRVSESLKIAIIGTYPLQRGDEDWNPGFKDFDFRISENAADTIIVLYRPDVDLQDEYEQRIDPYSESSRVFVRVLTDISSGKRDHVFRFSPKHYRFEDFEKEQDPIDMSSVKKLMKQ